MSKDKVFKERSPEGVRDRQELLGKALVHFKAELTGKKRVLDAGCGDGILYTMFGKQVSEEMILEGMDISQDYLNVSIRKAKENNLSIKYFLGSVTDIPCEENTYDILFSTMMFHHLAVETKMEALKEFYRVLKKGGKLIFVDLYPPKGFLNRLLWVRNYVVNYIHHEGTTRKLGKIERLLKQYGFAITLESYLEHDKKIIIAQK